MFESLSIESVAIVAVLVAIVAFFYSNLGLGGGQLYVPIMDLFFLSLFMKEIVPLSLLFAFFTMLTATFNHNRKGLVDFRLGIPLALAGLLGVAAGVMFTSSADERFVKGCFAGLLLIVASKMMYDIYRAKKENSAGDEVLTFNRKLMGLGVSVLTGFLVGSFGIGGGVVSVPLIIYVFRYGSRKAIGTSALMGAILTPAAFAAYVLQGGVEIRYDLAVMLTPIIFVMGFMGSNWGLAKLKTPVVKTIFTCGVYLAAAEMIYSLITQ